MSSFLNFSKRGQKGFTLIEIIVVMVIIVSAIGLAAPRIGKSLEKIRVRTVVRRFAAILRYSRQIAISRKKEYAVSIPDDHSYSYIKVGRGKNLRPDSEKEDETSESTVKTERFSERNLKEDNITVDLYKELNTEQIKIWYQKVDSEEADDSEGSPGEVIFYPKGESTGGLVFFKLGELVFQIEIDPITGRVIVKRKDEEA